MIAVQALRENLNSHRERQNDQAKGDQAFIAEMRESLGLAVRNSDTGTLTESVDEFGRPQIARMFFRDALKLGLVEANPFAEVTATAIIPEERRHYVTREVVDRLLGNADLTWRCIISLSRYGGLRCPSEVLSLRWEGVDWENDKIDVISPKTEHRGRGRRMIPLFPELREVLLEAKEAAEPDAEFVVPGDLRAAADSPTGWRNCNLRTQFKRIIERCGLTPWPKLFQSMRSSRETELAREHPIHVVTAWMGNTPKVALKHYLQVTDDDFAKASGRSAESSAPVAQNPAQHVHASPRTESPETTETKPTPDLVPTDAKGCESAQLVGVGDTGFEQLEESREFVLLLIEALRGALYRRSELDSC